jgi:hypothetical protein
MGDVDPGSPTCCRSSAGATRAATLVPVPRWTPVTSVAGRARRCRCHVWLRPGPQCAAPPARPKRDYIWILLGHQPATLPSRLQPPDVLQLAGRPQCRAASAEPGRCLRVCGQARPPLARSSLRICWLPRAQPCRRPAWPPTLSPPGAPAPTRHGAGPAPGRRAAASTAHH